MSRKTEFRNYPVPDENAMPPESGSEAFLLLRSAVEAVDMDIQDVLDALNGKAGIEHHHQISDIEALQKALDEKMPGNRQFRLDDLNDVDGADSAPIGYVLVKTADGWFAQSALAAVGNHDHSMEQITGLTEALNLKQGTSGKGVANGYASLGTDGKVPVAQLPSLTTTATVGAALAEASGKAVPADGDRFAGVLAGASTVFHTTWGNIKAALAALFVNKAGDTMTGNLLIKKPGMGAVNLASGDATNPGFIEFFHADGKRAGYVGWNRNGRVSYSAESGFTGHHFNGDIVADTQVRAGGGIAILHTDGNVEGSLWQSFFGDRYAVQGVYNRIEKRAQEWANDRVANLQYRKVSQGWVEAPTSAAAHAPGGAVVTGMTFDSGGNPHQVYGFFYMYLQVYDPVRGWVGFQG